MRPIPISEHINEELAERGWSCAEAVRGMDGDPRVNQAWLEIVCCSSVWLEHGDRIEFTQDDAERLSRIFGTSPELWIGLHGKFMRVRDLTGA